MRWDGQTIEADEQGRLPGYGDTAVIRRFKAPEAIDTRFYEVRAKSALNRVPEKSRVPFGWTVNPYRGCSHACSYCLSGDTPVLMGDGRTRPIRDLRPGDAIYGTVGRGAQRRYARTHVLDHWTVRKAAYRVTLEDGTELVTSGDHRFLTDRGWKHVAGADWGPLQRPHLTLNNRVIGTGAFAEGPIASRDYKRGYLCGAARGDGVDLTDVAARARVEQYAEDVRAGRSASRFATAGDRERPAARTAVATLPSLTQWPCHTTLDWCKGYLAGIFDVDGSEGGDGLRISSAGPAINDWIRFACRRLGFPPAVERAREGRWDVRIRGGLEQQLRFFHLTDPAITRKRTIEGRAIPSDSRLRVVSIQPLGVELPLYDITTGSGDFIANGVVSHNCFARPTHEYLNFDAGRDFEREIVVKVNVPEVLRAELARPSWKHEHVAMGTNTDPYQWVEGRYKLMRGIWEALRDAANPCSILTKSPLLLRDLELMREIAQVTDISACLSVPTLDEKAWRASEPHTPHPRARLEAVGELNRAGIPTGILIAPLMPGINDAPEQVEQIIALATEAGATSIGGNTLFLRGAVREIFFDWLRSYRPDLVPRYDRLYASGAYVPQKERRAIERAAGLPRLRGYVERFEHRKGMRRDAPPAPPDVDQGRQAKLF